MSTLTHRTEILTLADEAVRDSASFESACALIEIEGKILVKLQLYRNFYMARSGSLG